MTASPVRVQYDSNRRARKRPFFIGALLCALSLNIAASGPDPLPGAPVLADVSTIAVAVERDEAPVANCTIRCGVNPYSAACPVNKTPVCQCDEKPYARCRELKPRNKRK